MKTIKYEESLTVRCPLCGTVIVNKLENEDRCPAFVPCPHMMLWSVQPNPLDSMVYRRKGMTGVIDKITKLLDLFDMDSDYQAVLDTLDHLFGFEVVQYVGDYLGGDEYETHTFAFRGMPLSSTRK